MDRQVNTVLVDLETFETYVAMSERIQVVAEFLNSGPIDKIDVLTICGLLGIGTKCYHERVQREREKANRKVNNITFTEFGTICK